MPSNPLSVCIGLDVTTGHLSPTEPTSYTLATMTPQQVHTGLIPQHKLNEENDFVKQLYHEHDHIASIFRISNNGYQQYKRTRSAASFVNLKKCKQLVKQNLLQTIHPLLHGLHPQQCNSFILQQQAYIQTLQTYRPHLTVFETNIGTGCINNNHKQQQLNKHMMVELRKTTANSLERNKVRRQLEALDAIDELHGKDGVAQEGEDESVEEEEIQLEELLDDNDDANEHVLQDEYHHSSMFDTEEVDETLGEREDDDGISILPQPVESKKRLSAADKRKLKKYGQLPTYSPILDEIDSMANASGNRYQDQKHYMSYGTENEQATYQEEAMQPLADLRTSETFGTYLPTSLLIREPHCRLRLLLCT
jgi:hypothetical protein